MKLPFGFLPAHWGLKGKTKAIIQAEYELEGESLERKLAEINIEDENELALKFLTFDRKYKHITKEDYDYKYAKLKFTDGHEGTLATLELDKKYNKITNMEYEKAVYSLEDKPWVGVTGSEYNPEHGTSGFAFELDWNDAFVDMCVIAGYSGSNDEQIVEQWFEDVATEQYHTEKMVSEQEFMEGTEYGVSIPTTKTKHERIDKTKTKHS